MIKREISKMTRYVETQIRKIFEIEPKATKEHEKFFGYLLQGQFDLVALSVVIYFL